MMPQFKVISRNLFFTEINGNHKFISTNIFDIAIYMINIHLCNFSVGSITKLANLIPMAFVCVIYDFGLSDHLKNIYLWIVRFIDLQPKCILQSIFNVIFLGCLVKFHARISIISFQFVILSSTILYISINRSSSVYDKPAFPWNTTFPLGSHSCRVK